MATRTQRLTAKFTKDPALREKSERHLKDALLSHFIEADVAKGLVTREELQSPEARRSYLEGVIDRVSTSELAVAVDHTDTLRRLGLRHERNGDLGLAALLYGTWCEHVLNEIISVGVTRAGHADNVARQMIRDLSFQAKLTWTLPILGLRALPEVHVARIRRVVDLRNQYAHYKWEYRDLDDSARQEEQGLRFLSDCRKSLTFLARYRANVVHSGARSKITKLLQRNA